MTLEKILDELQKLSKTLTIAHSDKIYSELEKLASTEDRKKIWILIDGERTSKQISNEIDVSKRSVDRFLKILEVNGWVNNPWGKPPTRVIDHVPKKWIELLSDDNGEE